VKQYEDWSAELTELLTKNEQILSQLENNANTTEELLQVSAERLEEAQLYKSALAVFDAN
jgi:hypothetical protein